MLTKTIHIDGPVTAKVESVSLVPQFNDWRTREGTPALAYRVKLALPLPADPRTGVAEVARATMWIGADLVINEVTGEELVTTIGIESGTPMIPTADMMGASCEEVDGKVKLVDGRPVPTGADANKSHWYCARLVPTKGGSTLSLMGLMVTPVTITSGVNTGEFAVTKKGEQVVALSAEDWEPGMRAGKRANGGPVSGLAGKGAVVPEWIQGARAEAALEHATA